MRLVVGSAIILVEQLACIRVKLYGSFCLPAFFVLCVGDGEEGLTAYVEPFVILLILVLNAIVAIWQDSNADNALEALMDMQAQECNVLRNGEWLTIEAKDLVPGDVV